MSEETREVENWLHLGVEKSPACAGTHSTGKLQMVMADSEHLPEVGTTEDREEHNHCQEPNFYVCALKEDS